MCLIICSPKGLRPAENIIDDAYSHNSHGAGIAWVHSNGRIRWKKGLDLEGIKAALAEVPDGAAFTMHFRIASVGPQVAGLTHPFPVTAEVSLALEGEADSVFFQNGTYSQWEDKLLAAVITKGLDVPLPPWSDSRALALVCHAYGPNILYLLNNSSRFVVFTGGATPEERKLKVIGDWAEHEGIHYSNKYSEPFTRPYTTTVHQPTQQNFTPSRSISTQSTAQNSGTNASAATVGNARLTTARSTNRVSSGAFPVWEAFDGNGLEKGVEA